MPEVPTNANLGPALAVARVAAGMSVDDLAGRLNLTPREVRRWEAGKASPKPDTVHQAAEVLCLELAELEQIAELLTKAAERRTGRPRPRFLTRLSHPDGTPFTHVEARERAAQLLAEAVGVLGGEGEKG